MTVGPRPREARQRNLCSVIAREQGTDPIGSAWAVERMILMELPLPWPEDFFAARAFPAGLGDTLMAIWERHPTTGVLAIAPDKDHSRPGWKRVIDFRYPPPPRAVATRSEYLVPDDRVGAFVAALFDDDPAARAMPGIERVAFSGRDLLVCTHGAVDACCAMFGYPLYRDLRRMARESVVDCRVWRSAHFGGHRFAPTVLDFPEGRFWGFLSAVEGESLILRGGDPAALRERYRGWAGYEDPRAQVLEREALIREGWAWTAWPRRCELLEQDAQGNARLRISALPPSSAPVAYEGWVDAAGTVRVMHSTDGEWEDESVYAVRDVRRVELAVELLASETRELA